MSVPFCKAPSGITFTEAKYSVAVGTGTLALGEFVDITVEME